MFGFFNQIGAIALLTIKEVHRKKALLIVFLFAIALLGASVFFHSVDPESKFKLFLLWSIRAMVLLSVVISIFVAGFSLPQDIDKRRIHNLVSKPVSKIMIVLGKICGFAAVTFAALVLMSLVSLAFIFILQLSYGNSSPSVSAFPEITTKNHRITVPDERTHAVTREKRIFPAEYEYVFDNVPNDSPFIRLDIGIGHFKNEWYYNTKLKLVLGSVEREGLYNNKETYTVPIPENAIKNGRLVVTIKRIDNNAILEFRDNSCILLAPSEPFALNYFKGTFFVFLQTMLIVSVCIAATTWLHSATSIMLALLIFLVCNIYGFLYHSTKEIAESIKIQEEHSIRTKHSHSVTGIPTWMLKGSSAVTSALLVILPDFGKMDPSRFFLEDVAIGFNDLANAFLEIFYRFFPLVFLGCILIMFRDFSA